MKLIILYALMIYLPCLSCNAQMKATLHYLGDHYTETKNKGFINREMLFLENIDTFRINIKIPFDVKNPQIINPGIFYNCNLKKDSIYTIKFKKICAVDIPDEYYSYYKINTTPDKEDCSKFTELEKNTDYKYTGHYGEYVDINGSLFEVTDVNPSGDCHYPH